ncbi:MAG: hypothetical protein VB957_14085 [Pseudomonadales bacterium]
MQLGAINRKTFADYREVDFSALSKKDILIAKKRAISNAVQARGNDRVALLTSSPLEFGLGRMFQMTEVNDALVMEVLQDVDEALHWLDLPYSTLE